MVMKLTENLLKMKEFRLMVSFKINSFHFTCSNSHKQEHMISERTPFTISSYNINHLGSHHKMGRVYF